MAEDPRSLGAKQASMLDDASTGISALTHLPCRCARGLQMSLLLKRLKRNTSLWGAGVLFLIALPISAQSSARHYHTAILESKIPVILSHIEKQIQKIDSNCVSSKLLDSRIMELTDELSEEVWALRSGDSVFLVYLRVIQFEGLTGSKKMENNVPYPGFFMYPNPHIVALVKREREIIYSAENIPKLHTAAMILPDRSLFKPEDVWNIIYSLSSIGPAEAKTFSYGSILRRTIVDQPFFGKSKEVWVFTDGSKLFVYYVKMKMIYISKAGGKELSPSQDYRWDTKFVFELEL